MCDSLVKSLEQEYFKLDFVLLAIIKLISWNVRWYQYVPDYLIMSILQKLIAKYDLVYIMTTIKIIFEQNKRQKTTKSLFGKKKKKDPMNLLKVTPYTTIWIILSIGSIVYPDLLVLLFNTFFLCLII